jgi:hypothetical protein
MTVPLPDTQNSIFLYFFAVGMKKIKSVLKIMSAGSQEAN